MKRYKLVCTLTPTEILGHLALWMLIGVLTFGLALPAFLYSFVRLIINSTEVLEQELATAVPPPASAQAVGGRQHVMPAPKLIVPKPQV